LDKDVVFGNIFLDRVRIPGKVHEGVGGLRYLTECRGRCREENGEEEDNGRGWHILDLFERRKRRLHQIGERRD
jgi:hypothetical protein